MLTKAIKVSSCVLLYLLFSSCVKNQLESPTVSANESESISSIMTKSAIPVESNDYTISREMV